MRVQAVTFDFWNTLIAADGADALDARAKAWLPLLADHGHLTDTPSVLAAFDLGWRRYEHRWAANEQTDVTRFTTEALADLGVEPTRRLVSVLAEAYVAVVVARPHPLLPGAAEAVRALADAGVRLGIVCDVGMTPSRYLRGYLDDAGVLDAFDHWSFSDEVGCYKPDLAIFAHALDGLGTDPGAAAHVGDLRRTDMAGARAMGMTAVRYRAAFDDPPTSPVVEGHHVIDHHDHLVGVLAR